MLGFSYQQVAISYSYDAGLSQLSNYHSGSHEVILGLRLKKKAQEVCPAGKFW